MFLGNIAFIACLVISSLDCQLLLDHSAKQLRSLDRFWSRICYAAPPLRPLGNLGE